MPPGTGDEGRQGMSLLAPRGASRLALGFGAGDGPREVVAAVILCPRGWLLSQGRRRLLLVSLSPCVNLDQHEAKVLAEETSQFARLFGAVSPASQQRAAKPGTASAAVRMDLTSLAGELPALCGEGKARRAKSCKPSHACASALLPTGSLTHAFRRPPPVGEFPPPVRAALPDAERCRGWDLFPKHFSPMPR